MFITKGDRGERADGCVDAEPRPHSVAGSNSKDWQSCWARAAEPPCMRQTSSRSHDQPAACTLHRTYNYSYSGQRRRRVWKFRGGGGWVRGVQVSSSTHQRLPCLDPHPTPTHLRKKFLPDCYVSHRPPYWAAQGDGPLALDPLWPATPLIVGFWQVVARFSMHSVICICHAPLHLIHIFTSRIIRYSNIR